MAQSLYSRIRTHGTISEEPADVPDARFALPSTIHWMKALAILTSDLSLDYAAARKFYSAVQPRTLPDKELNTVCEQLLFALHQIAALRAMTAVPNKADVARVGIVTWYYGVYGASSAMIAAADGSFPDNHTETARQWHARFAAKKLAMPPFADCISDLRDSTVKSELVPLRTRGVHALIATPTDAAQAWGCCTEYLSGTAGWEQWNIRERIRETREFKALGVQDFKTKVAREFRDDHFQKHGIAFLHEASRYRGKANYRDAIYLGYGTSVPKLLESFIDDLLKVLTAFASMAGAYASLRMGKATWTEFVDDLDAKKAISVSPREIWK
jgi:hypothetical protein